MRSFRRLVLGLVLVILSPLSWGEDVYYCVEELSYHIKDKNSDGAFRLQRYQEAKFTFKYEADLNKLVFRGSTYEALNLECVTCIPTQSFFRADGFVYKFVLDDGRFFVAGAGTDAAEMQTGTCTKF